MNLLRCRLLSALLLSSCCSMAQTGYTVSGHASNMEKKSVELGNVIALSKKDSSLLKGNVFMDGAFRLEGIPGKEFFLQLSSLGLKDTLIAIAFNGADSVMELGNIPMRSNNVLKTVDIVAKTPMFENDGEKVKVNVESTGLSASGTLLDILRKSPGIKVSSSDNVSVFGKGSAMIYLDGQPIASTDMLNAIPSTEIKTIEIINNPSSKYDAAGRAVINIITKKNNLKGYNGSINENLRWARYFVSYSSLNLNYKNRKHSFSLSYGLRKGQGWSSDDYIRKFRNTDSTTLTMNNSIFDTRKHKDVHFVWLGYTYALDSLSSIVVQYLGSYDEKIANTDNKNEISQNGEPFYALHTVSKGRPVTLNQSANINYSKKDDTLGTEFFTALQYTSYAFAGTTHIAENYTGSGTSFLQEKQNRTTNNISIYTAQADLDKAFSKTWKLSSGIKDSYTTKDGEVKFDTYNAGEWLADTGFYNGSTYKENILAAYTELKFKKNKLAARAGLRGEQTYSDGFSKKRNRQIILRNYFSLFPNAFLGYDFTTDLSATATYSSRIGRPAFQDMDPFIDYIDSLSSFQGNPLLRPEYSHSVEASLIYKKEASLTFGYSRTKDALNLVVEKLNDGSDAFVASTQNLDRSEMFTAGITIPYELDWWTTSNYFGYVYSRFTYTSAGQPINNASSQFNISLYDEFRFKKLFSIEAYFNYGSAGADGIFATKPYSILTVVLKKTFFKEKLTCRVAADDALQSYVQAGTSNVPGYDVAFSSKVNSYGYVLSLSYKFGKLKTNNPYRTIGQEEKDRIKSGK